MATSKKSKMRQAGIHIPTDLYPEMKAAIARCIELAGHDAWGRKVRISGIVYRALMELRDRMEKEAAVRDGVELGIAEE